MGAVPPSAASRRVLVVEDEKPIRDLIQTVLSKAGYEVTVVERPTDAVSVATHTAPELILCDISMPEMDGHAVVRALREEPATANTPVMFVTAIREFTERMEAFKFGVVDYLTKPFTHEVLLRKVEKALSEGERRAERLRRKAPAGGGSAEADAGGADPPRLVGSEGEVSLDELPRNLRSALVVDDNPDFRGYVKGLLESQGFVVIEAADGETALGMALEHRPWLILSDVAMPGGDGISLCRAVRRHSLIRHTPLIFLSGWDDYRDRDRGLEAGADEFVSKHTPPRELLIRIGVVLNRFARLGASREQTTGMQGRLELVGSAGLLQMCHLGQLSGELTAGHEGAEVRIRFRDGEIVGASSGELEGEPALLVYLAWTEGSFRFVPGDGGKGSALGETFSQLLLEACRKLDEGTR